jgi:hypothetical protein
MKELDSDHVESAAYRILKNSNLELSLEPINPDYSKKK